MKRIVSCMILTLFLVGILALKFNARALEPVQTETICINGDGSVSPSPAPISTVDNVTYTFTGNISNPAYNGIVVERNNIIIDGNGYTVQGNQSGNGLTLMHTINVTIKNTNICEFLDGIFLESSNNSTISDNNASSNGAGIALFSSSSNNYVSGNNIRGDFPTTAGDGIYLDSSPNNTISGNTAKANFEGISLWYSSGETVNGNNVTANDIGIVLISSSNNAFSGNNVTANSAGIDLDSSSNSNTFGGNIIDGFNTTANSVGIFLHISSSNLMTTNKIENNNIGLQLSSAPNNTIFHNDFIGNGAQASVDSASVGNTWDDGYPPGGNYWSDYNGTDLKSGQYQNVTGSDGIGDTPYAIDANNTDDYPLMGLYYEFFPSFFSNGNASVSVISNSTVSDLIYSIWLSTPHDGLQGGQPFIEFLTSGQNGSIGFCRVTIPRTILNGSSYTVWVDYNPVNATELPISNGTYAYLYFTYTQPKHQIIVTIPEFSSLTLPLFITATLLAIATYKKKHSSS